MTRAAHVFAIKAAVADVGAGVFTFEAHKTMYGGKTIAVGDTVFLFASENDGGAGLFARGLVTRSDAVPKVGDVARQTPRVSVSVARSAVAGRPLGRAQLRDCTDWSDDRGETELAFKLYRQATNKIVGLTPAAVAVLEACFQRSV